jgi:hypothetical protein
MTPTMVAASWSRTIARPITPGSLPYSDCHSAWLTTTAFADVA